jgi:DNA phosphorothioation-dependent restriction protein DptG
MNNSTFEPLPQDLAMDQFWRSFDLPLVHCHVLKDGKLMRFRVSSDRLLAVYLLKANAVIEQEQLPLEAEIDEWKVSGVIFDRWLVLKFDASKLIPINY